LNTLIFNVFFPAECYLKWAVLPSCTVHLLLLGNNALNFNQVKTPEHERG